MYPYPINIPLEEAHLYPVDQCYLDLTFYLNQQSYRNALKEITNFRRDLHLVPERLQRDIQKDADLLAKMAEKFSQQQGVRVGDWIETQGQYARVTYLWSTSLRSSPSGSWSIASVDRGHTGYSGTMNAKIPFDELTPSGTAYARFWFWHLNQSGRDNGIEALIPVLIYTRKATG